MKALIHTCLLKKKNQAKQYRTTQVMPPSVFLFFTFSGVGKTLSFHHKKNGLNYPDFFYRFLYTK